MCDISHICRLSATKFGSVSDIGEQPVLRDFGEVWFTFLGAQSFDRVTKFGMVRGLANQHLFPEFRELWSGVPAIPCVDLHQSFTDALV